MNRWRSAAAAATLCLLTAELASAQEDAATLLRVFLRDGTALVSYGEFARVADRVVFSMPTDVDAESAAAARQHSRRSRRLGAHDAVRRRRARGPLRRDAGGERLHRDQQLDRRRPQPGGVHSGSGAAAGGGRECPESARRVAAEPLQLSRRGDPADGVDAGRVDRRPARLGRRKPVRAESGGDRRTTRGDRIAVAAADADGDHRAVADPVPVDGLGRRAAVAPRSRSWSGSIAMPPTCPPGGRPRRRRRRAKRSTPTSASNAPTRR